MEAVSLADDQAVKWHAVDTCDVSERKSVGIITYHYFHNYGAVLQAYALSRVIAHLGYECRIIDFQPESDTSRMFPFPKNPAYWPGTMARLLYLRDHQKCRKNYEEFIQSVLPLTDSRYRSATELRNNPPRFDTYVCGSDQIWYPSLLDREFGLPFLLDFVLPESRRVAYAPSFGVQEIPDRYRSVMAEKIAKFDALSVREVQGKAIVTGLVNRDAEHVLDPTLLMDAAEFEQIAVEPQAKGDFVLVYPMETGAGDSFIRLVGKIRGQLRLPFYFVFPSMYSNRWLRLADKCFLDAGPREFLGLLSQARLVLTNSFHGTALSILFGRPFLGSPHSATNTRISGLLTLVNLSDRQVTNPDVLEKTNLLESFDFEPVRQRLAEAAAQSIDYLRRAL